MTIALAVALAYIAGMFKIHQPIIRFFRDWFDV